MLMAQYEGDHTQNDKFIPYCLMTISKEILFGYPRQARVAEKKQTSLFQGNLGILDIFPKKVQGLNFLKIWNETKNTLSPNVSATPIGQMGLETG